MQAEMNRQQEVANKAKSTWDRFRKERDFHKMHHKRVVQEKNKLVVDLKRLKNHYSNFEPMLQMMRAKCVHAPLHPRPSPTHISRALALRSALVLCPGALPPLSRRCSPLSDSRLPRVPTLLRSFRAGTRRR